MDRNGARPGCLECTRTHRTSPRPAVGSERSTLRSIVWTLTLCAALLPHASAQAPRSGIRIEYTAIDTMGGQAGRAFLPMSSRDVSDLSRTFRDFVAPCTGPLLRLKATARQTRGAIRSVALTIDVRVPATLPLERGACPGAFVETTLEDGSVLSGGRGEVVVSNIVLPGRIAGFVTGRFTQTAMRNGTPVTIRGEFRIPLPVPAPAGGGSSRGHISS